MEPDRSLAAALSTGVLGNDTRVAVLLAGAAATGDAGLPGRA